MASWLLRILLLIFPASFLSVAFAYSPGQPLQQARMVPELENSQVIGFRFVSVLKDSRYYKMGFREGDIVTSIDGEPLTSAQTFLQAMEDKKGIFSVKRNGKVIRIQLPNQTK